MQANAFLCCLGGIIIRRERRTDGVDLHPLADICRLSQRILDPRRVGQVRKEFVFALLNCFRSHGPPLFSLIRYKVKKISFVCNPTSKINNYF